MFWNCHLAKGSTLQRAGMPLRYGGPVLSLKPLAQSPAALVEPTARHPDIPEVLRVAPTLKHLHL